MCKLLQTSVILIDMIKALLDSHSGLEKSLFQKDGCRLQWGKVVPGPCVVPCTKRLVPEDLSPFVQVNPMTK
jgi:hypothetical protein